MNKAYFVDGDAFDREAPTLADLANATDLTPYLITEEQMKAMYHAMTFRRGVLGQFSLGYTPAEELRDRLNARLQGREPAPAVNTRYWRNL